jgi:hypothetical protein
VKSTRRDWFTRQHWSPQSSMIKEKTPCRYLTQDRML